MGLRELKRHRSAIVDFVRAYAAYLKAGPERDLQLRAQVLALIPSAQAAMDAAGIEPVMYPPRAIGGPVLTGLPNLAFGYESPGFGFSDIPKSVIDWGQLTAATLNDRVLALQRKRRNPLYWVDATLRALLGIPAYIVSLFFQTSPARISASPVGPLLKLLSAFGQIAAIYFGGRGAGWW
jgi:hypothetical protein